MKDAHHALYCVTCTEENIDAGRWEMPPPMRRVFTPPLKAIIRPSGYRLSPDDPKFGDFRRELELGEIVDDATPVQLSQAELDAFDNPRIEIAPDPERERKLHQLVAQHWTEDLSDDTVRRRELAAAHQQSEG